MSTSSSDKNSLNPSPLSQRQQKSPKSDEARPKARLCHLKKWPHFQGYGFNLHAERSRLGQHIGKVDANSPAESAGLREGDRIIEVNYVNISNENHQQVVKRIRSGLDYDGVTHDDEVLLLVVDRQADEWFKTRGIVVRSTSGPDQIVRMSTASTTTPPNDEEESPVAANDHNNNHQVVSELKTPLSAQQLQSQPSPSSSSSASSSSSSPSPPSSSPDKEAAATVELRKSKMSSSSNSSITNGTATALPQQQTRQQESQSSQTVTPKSISSNIKQVSTNKSLNGSAQSTTTSTATKKQNVSNSSSTASSTSSSLNRTSGGDKSTISTFKDDVYKMSAAEFRNYLKSKGRNDPRGISIDMRRKYEIFQNM